MLLTVALSGAFALVYAIRDSLHLVIHRGGIVECVPAESVDSIIVGENNLVFCFASQLADTLALPIDSIAFRTQTCDTLYISWRPEGVGILNPFKAQNVSVEADSTHAKVTNHSGHDIPVCLNGQSNTGRLTLKGDYPIDLVMCDLHINSITLKGDSTVNLQVNGENNLSCIKADGDLNFYGKGRLSMDGEHKNSIKSEGNIRVSDCALHFYLSKPGSKGMKSDKSITLSNASISGIAVGDANIVDGGVEYCTFVKCDGQMTIDNSSIELRHAGKGGRGLSARQNLLFVNSTLRARFDCDGEEYINAQGETDYYTSRVLDGDKLMGLQSGKVDILQTGLGGKGVSCGERLEMGVLGAESDSTLLIDIETTGTAIVNDTILDERFGCPKAIKGKTQVYVYSGIIHAVTHGVGGEGIECGKGMKVEGGEIICEAFDDGINVGKNLKINGGRVFAFSSNNDGIDSNGDLTLGGGVVVAMNSFFRDEDFDCDEGCDFAINGGTVLGVARDFSRPTLINQPYIQHTPALWRPDYAGKDSVNVHDFNKGSFVVIAKNDGTPVISAKILEDIPSAFITASEAFMRVGEDVYIYRADRQPDNSAPILGGRVYLGGERLAAPPLLNIPATTEVRGVTTE